MHAQRQKQNKAVNHSATFHFKKCTSLLVLLPVGRDTGNSHLRQEQFSFIFSIRPGTGHAHLLTFGLAAVSPHHQVICLLADIASYFSSVTFNQRLGLISFNALQNTRNYKCQAFQAVFSSLRTRELQKMPLLMQFYQIALNHQLL